MCRSVEYWIGFEIFVHYCICFSIFQWKLKLRRTARQKKWRRARSIKKKIEMLERIGKERGYKICFICHSISLRYFRIGRKKRKRMKRKKRKRLKRKLNPIVPHRTAIVKMMYLAVLLQVFSYSNFNVHYVLSSWTGFIFSLLLLLYHYRKKDQNVSRLDHCRSTSGNRKSSEETLHEQPILGDVYNFDLFQPASVLIVFSVS